MSLVEYDLITPARKLDPLRDACIPTDTHPYPLDREQELRDWNTHRWSVVAAQGYAVPPR